MIRPLKIIVLGFLFLCVFHPGGEEGFSQTSNPVTDLPVQIGSIDFRIREIEATPSPIRMLEIQIEIINRSNKVTVPPNAIKVVAMPKDVQFASSSPGDFAPIPGEVTWTLPFPPMSVQVGIVGFSLPQEKLQSISFDIQINPPEGEKKTATFHF
jgi:hypothetical protein